MDQLQLTKRKASEFAYSKPKQNFTLWDKEIKMEKIYVIAGASAERGIENLSIEHSPTNSLQIINFWKHVECRRHPKPVAFFDNATWNRSRAVQALLR